MDINISDIIEKENKKEEEVKNIDTPKEEPKTEAVDDPGTQEEVKKEEPKAENKKEEVKPEEPKVPLENIISVHDCIMKNIDKITNCSIVSLEVNDVYKNKYMMFKTNVSKDQKSDLIFFEDCDYLYLEDFVPTSIVVQKSGITILSDTKKAFVTKMNVISFTVENGLPTEMKKYKRCVKDAESLTCEVTKAEKQYSNVDEIKIKVKSVCPRLFSVIKDTTDVSEIKKEILTFADSVSDINYIIKINKELLMEINI